MMLWEEKISKCYFQFLSIVVLMNIEFCFGQNSSDLASSSGTKMFLDRLFYQYGENNGTSMSPANFKILLKQLSVGSVVLERPDKYCKFKGVHTGIEKEAGKTDSVSDGASKTGTNNKEQKSENLLRRERRSGGHDHDDKNVAKENPKHNQHLQKHYQQCLSTHKIFEQHNLNENATVTRESLLRLCPALLHQAAGGYCIHRHNCSEPPSYYITIVNKNMVWLYGFIAITVVSLASLCIIAVIPCLEKGFYQRVMGYLVALAVGTLAGDALLHLIPHAFQSQTEGTLEVDHKKNIWKSCFVLLGIYAFFFVEQLMKMKTFFKNKKREKKLSLKKKEKDESDASRCAKSSADDINGKKPVDANSDDRVSPDVTSDTELMAYPPGDEKSGHDDHDPHDHLEKHDHHTNPHDLEHNHGHSHGTIDNKTSIASVAWMVIVGDGFHNFSDGLAIGAAFAASYTSGVSTAIAVFCHELPHELGDFAVLIKSGMSIRQAVCYNLVSAVLSYIGLVIGIIVGNYSADGKQFALAVTAGLFLYVALANMLPELTSTIDDDVGDAWSFISPHLGILTGIVIMLLISIFEDKI